MAAKKKMLSVRVEPGLFEEVDQAAQAAGLSRTGWVEKALSGRSGMRT